MLDLYDFIKCCFSLSVIFENFGYYASFGTSGLLNLFALLYIVIFVKETRGPNATYGPLTVINPVQDRTKLVTFQHVADVFKTCFKPRENKARRMILLLIFSMILNLSIFSKLIKFIFLWNEIIKIDLSIHFQVSVSISCTPDLNYLGLKKNTANGQHLDQFAMLLHRHLFCPFWVINWPSETE